MGKKTTPATAQSASPGPVVQAESPVLSAAASPQAQASPEAAGASPAEAKAEQSSLLSLGGLKALLEISALLAAAGFVSLRAHFNVLGLSAMSSLGSERYLVELYRLVYLLLFPLALVALVAHLVPARAGSWLAHPRARLYALGLNLAMIVAIRVFAFPRSDMVVGTLNAGDIEALWNFQRGWGATWVLLTAIVACAGLLPLLWRRQAPASPAQAARFPVEKKQALPEAFLWNLHLASCLIVLLHVALVHGALSGPRMYPLAWLQQKEGPERCGLMLYETDKVVGLWIAAQGVGSTLELNREAVTSLHVGEVLDILGQARQAAGGGGAPNCEQQRGAFRQVPPAAPGP